MKTTNKLSDYIYSRGLTPTLVSQKMGVSRQALADYGRKSTPTAKTLCKVAKAMTELGVETTAMDLVPLFNYM